LKEKKRERRRKKRRKRRSQKRRSPRASVGMKEPTQREAKKTS